MIESEQNDKYGNIKRNVLNEAYLYMVLDSLITFVFQYLDVSL